MIIEGRIVSVMETWPLQLAVQGEGSVVHVQLTDQTSLLRGGSAIDPGEISPSMRVEVKGQPLAGDPSALIADSVRVLD